MKIRVMSDVHLEFGDFDPGHGDVLVLAGDICVAETYFDFHDFFVQCAKNYNKVFYVTGNHENYHGDFEQTESILRNNLPKEIVYLQNQSVFYEGVHFVGATLWTDMNKGDSDTMDEARSRMNDYHLVDNFSPEVSVSEHQTTKDWFERCIPTLNGDVFVITHHAPSPKSIHGRYLESTPMYSSEMEDFIIKYPNIKYWAHGHCHFNNDYMVDQCRVISNPRGYHLCEENREFDPTFEIDLTPSPIGVIV